MTVHLPNLACPMCQSPLEVLTAGRVQSSPGVPGSEVIRITCEGTVCSCFIGLLIELPPETPTSGETDDDADKSEPGFP